MVFYSIFHANGSSKLFILSYEALTFLFFEGKKKYTIIIEFNETENVVHLGPNLEWSLVIKSFKVLLDNGDEGYGVLHFGMRYVIAPSNYPSCLVLLPKQKIRMNCDVIII